MNIGQERVTKCIQLNWRRIYFVMGIIIVLNTWPMSKVLLDCFSRIEDLYAFLRFFTTPLSNVAQRKYHINLTYKKDKVYSIKRTSLLLIGQFDWHLVTRYRSVASYDEPETVKILNLI